MVASSLARITTSCNLLVSNYLSRSNSSSYLFRKNKNHNLRPLCSYYRPAGTIRCCLSATTASVVELTENKKKTQGSSSSSSHSSSSIQTALTVWLLKQEQAGVIDAELAVVLSSISIACKQIASLLQRANISKLTGAQGTVNVQGEDQKKLDVISNEVFCSCLRSSGRTGIIASEEEDVPIAVEESYSGNYIVVFDPLDGSANIDCALPTGSIFGIYSPNEVCLATDADDRDSSSTLDQVTQKCIVDVCQPGSNLLAAGYCMYSSSVVFVLTIGNGVYMFTLDQLYGEFVLTHADVKMPRSGNIYAFNEGNYQLWDDNLKRYVDHLKNPGGPNGKRYTARYIGSLVVEIHRTLLYGGIYGNPWNHQSKKGKLRLLYECAPMSFIVEQAGGKGTNGYKRILDIQPEAVHERVSIFIGSVEEVEELERYLLA